MTASSEPELANAALEFHDSEVSSIEAVAGDIQVFFAAAYVHRSNGTPGVNGGKGYVQAVELHLDEVRLLATSTSAWEDYRMAS
jgi:hypothetical protein